MNTSFPTQIPNKSGSETRWRELFTAEHLKAVARGKSIKPYGQSKRGSSYFAVLSEGGGIFQR